MTHLDARASRHSIHAVESSGNTHSSTHTRGLAIGFASVAALTYILIVLGALVRANGAGLACPDWPLCFGEIVPDFDLKVAFEWGHRAVAGTVSVLFVALSIATLRQRALRPQLAPLLALGAALLALQILLGALTVWQLLAAWTVTSHLLTGNAFAIVLVLAATKLVEIERPPPAPAAPSAGVRRLVASTAALLVLQVVLGGLVSSTFSGLACPEWPTCAGGEWIPAIAPEHLHPFHPQALHLLHRFVAYGLLLALTCSALVTRGRGRLGTLLGLALVLGIAQVAAGVVNVLLRIPVEVTGIHSALAAALLLVLALSVRETFRSTPRRASAAVLQHSLDAHP